METWTSRKHVSMQKRSRQSDESSETPGKRAKIHVSKLHMHEHSNYIYTFTEPVHITGTIPEGYEGNKSFESLSYVPYIVQTENQSISIGSLHWMHGDKLEIRDTCGLPAKLTKSIQEVTSQLRWNNNKWEECSPTNSLSNLQQEIIAGFTCGFTNAMGRTAMFSLLVLLFQANSKLRVRNLGGRSPHSRQVVFHTSVIMTSSPDSCPGKSELSGWKSSTDSSPNKRDVRYSLDKMVKYHPDLVVIENGVHQLKSECLVVQVKSVDFSFRDKFQLLYQLLPSLMSNETALGLMINNQSALLIQLKVVESNGKKEMKFSEKMYNFISGWSHLLEMCGDLFHLVNT